MGLLKRIFVGEKTATCRHKSVVETRLHGLGRIVCGDCGHVAIATAKPVVTEARPITRRY